MKCKTGALLPFIIGLVFLSLAQAVSAENAGPAQKQKPGIYLLSQTDIDSVKDEELKSVYREADASLVGQVRDGLAAREINAIVVKSDRDITDPARFILVVKVDKIELGAKRPFGRTAKVKGVYTFQNKDRFDLGAKRPFGRTAKVKGVYTFQNKDRFDLVKRTQEETSVQKWQNCIKKISEQIVADTAKDLAKNSASPAADDAHVKPKPAPAGSASETRLRELEDVKAKGLITEKEYEEKRKEILNQL